MYSGSRVWVTSQGGAQGDRRLLSEPPSSPHHVLASWTLCARSLSLSLLMPSLEINISEVLAPLLAEAHRVVDPRATGGRARLPPAWVEDDHAGEAEAMKRASAFGQERSSSSKTTPSGTSIGVAGRSTRCDRRVAPSPHIALLLLCGQHAVQTHQNRHYHDTCTIYCLRAWCS